HAREILSMKQRLNEILARHTGQSLETPAHGPERDDAKSPEAAREPGRVPRALEPRPPEPLQPACAGLAPPHGAAPRPRAALEPGRACGPGPGCYSRPDPPLIDRLASA